MSYPCPCCGCLTLGEEPSGTFEICDVCGWEDDNVQFENPSFEGGANDVSLNQAKENYKKFGAIGEDAVKFSRKPRPEEIPPK